MNGGGNAMTYKHGVAFSVSLMDVYHNKITSSCA